MATEQVGDLDAVPTVDGAVSHRGVVFAERRGFRPLLLDVHVPAAAAAPVPWVLWVHGGGWEEGDRRSTPEHWPDGLLFRSLVAAGLGVVTVDYRLSAEAVHPAQLDDVRAGFAFARERAAELGLDPARVGVAGESAGGHLAALLALTAARPSPNQQTQQTEHAQQTPHAEPLQAAAVLYGVTDLTTLLDLQGRPPHERGDSPEARLLGFVPEDDPERAALASPVHHVTGDAPPMLLISGDSDRVVPVEQTVRLHDVLRAAGARDVVLDVVPGADHCFWDVDPVPPLQRVVAFLADRLRAAPA